MCVSLGIIGRNHCESNAAFREQTTRSWRTLHEQAASRRGGGAGRRHAGTGPSAHAARSLGGSCRACGPIGPGTENVRALPRGAVMGPQEHETQAGLLPTQDPHLPTVILGGQTGTRRGADAADTTHSCPGTPSPNTPCTPILVLGFLWFHVLCLDLQSILS